MNTWNEQSEYGTPAVVLWRIIYMFDDRAQYIAEPDFGEVSDGAEVIEGGLSYEEADRLSRQLNEVQR